MSYKNGLRAGYTDFRYGTAKPVTLAGAKTKPALTAGKRKAMAEKVAALFKDWRLSPFENEGPIRHGLRSTFCLDGSSWRRSDDEAAYLTEAAIRALGIERPSWAQGQPDHAREHDYCSWCNGPIDQERRTRRQRFCSLECARAAMLRRDFRAREHDGGVYSQARRMLAMSTAPLRDCVYCGQAFRSTTVDAKLCSDACRARYVNGFIPERPCERCGTVFKPTSKTTRFCSRQCAAATRWDADRQRLTACTAKCTACGAGFTPTNPRRKYCSHTCMLRASHAARKKWTGTLSVSCIGCGDQFAPKSPLNRYCGPDCRSIVTNIKNGSITRVSPRSFDHIVLLAGARITTEMRKAA